MNYAGFWVRVGAYLIDVLILFVAQFILIALFGDPVIEGSSSDFQVGFNMSASSSSPLLDLVLIVLAIAYFAGLESSKMQATLGKRALGLVVTDMNGNRISFLRALGRYLAKILSGLILFIGYIMVAFTERKQGLHDLLASTLVLKGTVGQVGYDPEVFS